MTKAKPTVSEELCRLSLIPTGSETEKERSLTFLAEMIRAEPDSGAYTVTLTITGQNLLDFQNGDRSDLKRFVGRASVENE